MPAELEHIDRKIKILLVDDHAATRDLVKAILRGTGFTDISQAENGSMAIEYIDRNPVQLVICDWNMPYITGLEVLKALRERDPNRLIPFIMLTAEAYKESIAAAVEAGVTDYIAKPFTADILLQKISRAFMKKKNQ